MKKARNELTAKAEQAGVEKVPNLIDEKTLGKLLMGDPEPFYFSLTFPNRVEGTGGIYDGYHKTVLDLIAENGKPLTGSKSGHDSQDRDFYFIGGEANETTTTYKGYIPPNGISSTNEGLKRAVNAGCAEFSIVANVPEEGDRKENGVPVFTKEYGRPVIDLVDRGAQTQQVSRNSIDEKKIFELISQNAVDYTNDGDMPVRNGKVCKMFFIKNQSVLENKGLAGRVLNAIGIKRKNTMTPEDIKAIVDGIVAGLKPVEKEPEPNAKKTNAALDEIKKLLSLEADADIDAVITAIKQQNEDLDEAADADAEERAEELAGPEKIDEETVNAANRYAFEKIKPVRVKNRKAFIEKELKNDAVFKALLGNNASGKTLSKKNNAGIFGGWGGK